MSNVDYRTIAKGTWAFQLKCAQRYLEHWGGNFSAKDSYNHSGYGVYSDVPDCLFKFEQVEGAFWGSYICTLKFISLGKSEWLRELENKRNVFLKGWTDIWDLGEKLKCITHNWK
jgi:hypothetical protein